MKLINVSNIYNKANLLDKTEEYYWKALSLEPENPLRLNNLAWLPIDYELNIEEGMVLIDKAVKSE